jgi:drug/metabolite transporter (DMT)-like permease
MNDDSTVISQPMSQYSIGIIYALMGTALFSIKPVLIKLAYQAGGDATAIMSLRAASSLPFYIMMLFWLCRESSARISLKKYGWQAALVGILGYYCASFLDILSLASISAQLERLLIFLYPTFVVLISAIVFKDRLKPGLIKAILIGYIGIAFIVAHDLTRLGGQVWYGSMLAIGSAFVFANYLILSKRLITRLGSQLFTSIGMGSAGLIILLQYCFFGSAFSEMSAELVTLGIATGFFCTVLPSYLVAAGMARLTPSVLSLTGNIGPVITTLFAVFLLGENFTIYHVIGIALVLWSVVIIGKRNKA